MKSRALSIAFAGLIVSISGFPDLQAQPPAPAAAEPAASERGLYVGISSCSNGICHGAAEPQEGLRVLGNEYTSRVLDPHYRAYEILESELSATIAGRLELGRGARDMPLCLDCHTVNVPPARNRGGLSVEDGVSCEGCHGPAGGWWNRHYEEGWSHRQSIREGMNDLRAPAARAAVCLRCHLGGAARGVDHRLIAAGHPILRFELDNYAEDPSLRHWKVDRQGRREGHGVEAWAAGQAAAFRAGLLQLAGKAEGDGPWPEFSELSCANCHHALDGAWSRRRGYRFRDGLPQWSPARWTVLRHLAAAVAPRRIEALELEVDALARQVASMRGRQDVARRARSLAESLDEVVSELGGTRWNRRRVTRLIRALASGDGSPGVARDVVADLASAEQIALSLHSLASHLTRRDPRLLNGPLVAAVDQLFTELQEPASFDRDRFAERLVQVAEALP